MTENLDNNRDKLTSASRGRGRPKRSAVKELSPKDFKGFNPERAKLYQRDIELEVEPSQSLGNHTAFPRVEILGPKQQYGYEINSDPNSGVSTASIASTIWSWEGEWLTSNNGGPNGGAQIPQGVDWHSTLWLMSFLKNDNNGRDGTLKSSSEIAQLLSHHEYEFEPIKEFMNSFNLDLVVLNRFKTTIMPSNPDWDLNPQPVETIGWSYETSKTMLNGILIYKMPDGFYFEYPGPHQAGKNFDGINWARCSLKETKDRLFNNVIMNPCHWVTTGLPHQYVTEDDRPELGTNFRETYIDALSPSVRQGRAEYQELRFYDYIDGFESKRGGTEKKKKKGHVLWDTIRDGYHVAKCCCLAGIQFRDYFHYVTKLQSVNTSSRVKLRNLICTTYPWSLDKQVIFEKIYYDLMNEWSENLKQRFLSTLPVLEKWLPVLSITREPEIWDFVLLFLEAEGIIIDPGFWAGHNLDFIIILYYVQVTKNHLLYAKDEDAFYRYNGQFWDQISQQTLMTDVKGFYSSKNAISGISARLSNPSKSLMQEQIKSHITVETWPNVQGYNLKNGFMSLSDEGRYIFRQHHSGSYQRNRFETRLPALTSQPISDLVIRFNIDIAGNKIMGGNINKIADFISLSPASHNIIVNYTGNPRGAKTQKLNLILKLVGSGSSVGDLNMLNSFQLKDTLLNATIVAFPDCDPSTLKAFQKDLLKKISGKDPIRVEEKFGMSFLITPRCTLILTSNVTLEEFRMATDAGLADRLLTIQLPQVDNSARVAGLTENYMTKSEYLENYFSYILTAEPEVINGTIRAGTINAVTGMVKMGLEERYFTENLIADDKSFLYKKDLDKFMVDWGQELLSQGRMSRTDYNRFATLKGLSSTLNNWLGSWGEKKAAYKRRKEGMGWLGLATGTPREDSKRNLSLEAQKMQNVLLKNPLKQDGLVFHNSVGKAVTGPLLSPFINLHTFLNFLKVRLTNLRSIIEGKETGLQDNQHLESTGFGGYSKISNLSFKDFFEMRRGWYQPFFQIKDNDDLDRDLESGRFVYQQTDLTGLFSGSKGGILITGKPQFSSSNKLRERPAIRQAIGVAGEWMTNIYEEYEQDKSLLDSLKLVKYKPAIKSKPRSDYVLPWDGEDFLIDFRDNAKLTDRQKELFKDLLEQSVDVLVTTYEFEELEEMLKLFGQHYEQQLTTKQQKLFHDEQAQTQQLIQSHKQALNAPTTLNAYARQDFSPNDSYDEQDSFVGSGIDLDQDEDAWLGP